jgi:hypothetical protein
MRIQVIKTELDTDPLGLGYSGMDDSAAAVSLNEKTRSKLEPISSAELLAWSANGARLQSIKSAAESGADDTIKSVAQAAYLTITRDDTTLDLNLADRVALLDALVSYNVLTADDKASLESLATVAISRGEELGVGLVRAGDVIQARL